AADFDGDGCTDMLTQSSTAASNQLNFMCARLGTTVTIPYWLSASTKSMIFGDFNGDGLTDILIVDRTLSTGAGSLYLATGTGFVGPTTININGTTAGQIVTGDWNGDARTDIIVIGKSLSAQSQHLIYLSTGTNFSQVGSIPFIAGDE